MNITLTAPRVDGHLLTYDVADGPANGVLTEDGANLTPISDADCTGSDSFTFDVLISRTLADMSVCRNSTVIPLLTGRANVSFFCTGGITWGRNDPRCLTSG